MFEDRNHGPNLRKTPHYAESRLVVEAHTRPGRGTYGAARRASRACRRTSPRSVRGQLARVIILSSWRDELLTAFPARFSNCQKLGKLDVLSDGLRQHIHSYISLNFTLAPSARNVAAATFVKDDMGRGSM